MGPAEGGFAVVRPTPRGRHSVGGERGCLSLLYAWAHRYKGAILHTPLTCRMDSCFPSDAFLCTQVADRSVAAVCRWLSPPAVQVQLQEQIEVSGILLPFTAAPQPPPPQLPYGPRGVTRARCHTGESLRTVSPQSNGGLPFVAAFLRPQASSWAATAATATEDGSSKEA